MRTPKLHFRDTDLCAFLMGTTTRSELDESPLTPALWESMVCGELARLIQAAGASWQLSFWRDRTKKADFLLHRAGRFRLADAKWTEHPTDPGKLTLVRREMEPVPPAAIICRAANGYPIAGGIEALPPADLPALLDDRFPGAAASEIRPGSRRAGGGGAARGPQGEGCLSGGAGPPRAGEVSGAKLRGLRHGRAPEALPPGLIRRGLAGASPRAKRRHLRQRRRLPPTARPGAG